MRYNFAMPMTAHDLLEAASHLSQADRDWLVQELLHPPGDGSSEAEIAAAWDEEIKRRIDEVESGNAELVSLETVFAEMDEMLESNRLR